MHGIIPDDNGGQQGIQDTLMDVTAKHAQLAQLHAQLSLRDAIESASDGLKLL